MKVSVQEIPKSEEEEIMIRCHEINEEILSLLHRLKLSQEKLSVSRQYVAELKKKIGI